MSSFIRWQGLVGFVSIIVLLATLSFLFIDTLVKTGLEKSGEWYLGAEVNVDEVEVTFSPLSVTIIGFQATDPEKLTHNMVTFKEAVAGIDLWQYLFGKVHINDLTITQLELDKQRDSEGEVYFTPDSKGNATGTDTGLPSLEMKLPSVDDLLNNSNLQTVKQAKLLQETYKTEKAKLAAIRESLPSKEKLVDYQRQVKALSDIKVETLTDVEKVTQDFASLKKQFNADKKLVSEAKAKLQQSKDLIATQMRQLKEAPQNDWQAIEKEYSLEQLDAADFAHILFGKQAREYLGYVELAYKKLSPMLSGSSATPKVKQSRDGGEFVYFSEQSPQPSVLIENAHVSVVLAQGEVVIEGKELTHQHWIRARESTLNARSDNLKGRGTFALDMTFSLDEQQILKSDGGWQLGNLVVADVVVQESSALSLSLDNGLVSGKGTFGLLANQVKSINEVAINDAKYTGKASSSLTNVFLDMLQSSDSLAITVSATGPIMSPNLSVSSPLDNQFKGAVQKLVGNKLNSFKGDVTSGLDGKVASTLGSSHTDGKAFADLESLINGVNGSLTDLVNADVTKGHKKQLQGKFKDKIGSLFGN